VVHFGAQPEDAEENGVVPPKENVDWKEECQHQTPDDVCGP
jgi:hypothetical protein